MPIVLHLVPTRPSFCPGDVLTATLEVWHQHLHQSSQQHQTFIHGYESFMQQHECDMGLDNAIAGLSLQVKNVASSIDASAGPLELAGVNVDFRGTERIERSWIASSYAPSGFPVTRDGKREVRPIVETPPARLVMQDYTLMLGESRAWLVRCAKQLVYDL